MVSSIGQQKEIKGLFQRMSNEKFHYFGWLFAQL